jgi:hypothetical protein
VGAQMGPMQVLRSMQQFKPLGNHTSAWHNSLPCKAAAQLPGMLGMFQDDNKPILCSLMHAGGTEGYWKLTSEASSPKSSRSCSTAMADQRDMKKLYNICWWHPQLMNCVARNNVVDTRYVSVSTESDCYESCDSRYGSLVVVG